MFFEYLHHIHYDVSTRRKWCSFLFVALPCSLPKWQEPELALEQRQVADGTDVYYTGPMFFSRSSAAGTQFYLKVQVKIGPQLFRLDVKLSIPATVNLARDQHLWCEHYSRLRRYSYAFYSMNFMCLYGHEINIPSSCSKSQLNWNFDVTNHSKSDFSKSNS